MSTTFRNTIFIQIFLALLFAANAAPARAQTQTENQVAKTTVNPATSTPKAEAVPVLNAYRDVKIGMHASEVRDTLERYLKAKGDKQDFLVLSDNETAQIFYDGTGKVTAISIDYTAKNGNAPTPMDVLGADIEPKPDGSMYALKRYPAAGYWVSYNRTSGESPTVTITMQALR
jgi:hypothetical protein